MVLDHLKDVVDFQQPTNKHKTIKEKLKYYSEEEKIVITFKLTSFIPYILLTN